MASLSLSSLQGSRSTPVGSKMMLVPQPSFYTIIICWQLIFLAQINVSDTGLQLKLENSKTRTPVDKCLHFVEAKSLCILARVCAHHVTCVPLQARDYLISGWFSMVLWRNNSKPKTAGPQLMCITIHSPHTILFMF